VKNQEGIGTIAYMEKERSLFSQLEKAKIEGKEEIKMYDPRFTVNIDNLKAQMLDASAQKLNIEEVSQNNTT
jgi:hypothetical protein